MPAEEYKWAQKQKSHKAPPAEGLCVLSASPTHYLIHYWAHWDLWVEQTDRRVPWTQQEKKAQRTQGTEMSTNKQMAIISQ